MSKAKVSSKPTSVTKYCDDCHFYNSSKDECNKVIGLQDTPKRKMIVWGIPSIQNRSNNCEYFT